MYIYGTYLKYKFFKIPIVYTATQITRNDSMELFYKCRISLYVTLKKLPAAVNTGFWPE